ncbi:phage virion morphogenesis protein [Janthinobacterium fluminis]|uniref:Phage virion morphogenesis protein n=1 Tax=Janthinobacterium fluminis TaxID=2987524 RepID=A0ABT5JXN9_9BURK|nr:phage virion morphogenesis protein [Janthinobacterium fluminis]MDC8757509.1 phage virion morphogenesis protein [Janthinobacterium fluminis]
MTDNLHSLEAWAGALLARLQPAQRRAINHKVAIDLRRSQAQRIAAQQGPDGASYAARKPRKEWHGKAGRIKRKKAAMFNKIRTATYLKIRAAPGEITIGFFGRVARIARVHQDGLPDQVSKTGPRYKYPARPLLGFSESDRAFIRESLLRHMESI